MKQLVIFPKGALSPKDKERMSREGFLAIEADDPSKVVMPLPSDGVSGDDMTLCALKAMSGPGSSFQRSQFTEHLTTLLAARPSHGGNKP